MKKRAWAALVFAACIIFPESALAGAEFIKVVEITGSADIFDPVSASWAPHSVTPIQLKAGYRLRTHTGSSAEIVMDAKWDRLMHIGENTRISVLGDDLSRIALDEGRLYVLCEDEKKQTLPSKLLTKDVRLEFTVAGFGVSSGANGSLVQVFADFVTAFPKKSGKYEVSGAVVAEGFQFLFTPQAVENSVSERMSFDDYWKWQAWIKGRYAQKDKFHTKRTN